MTKLTTPTLVLFILLASASVHALDCSQTTNPTWCEEIQQSNLSDSDKEYLIADLVSSQTVYPDHALVATLNEETQIRPTQTHNSRFIRNAWVQIGAIEPSVVLNGELLVSPEGHIVADSGHEVVLAQGVDAGDCDTRRTISRNDAQMSYFINGEQTSPHYNIGTGAVEFEVRNDISVDVAVDHYTWQQPCQYCALICAFDRTEHQQDHLTITNIKEATSYQPELNASFEVLDSHAGMIRGLLTSSPFMTLDLQIGDAHYTQYGYTFSEYEQDSGLLQEVASVQPTQDIEGLTLSDGTILAPDSEECQITISSFFETHTLPCGQARPTQDFAITTDHLVYDEDDEILLHIEPEQDYTIEYAGEQYDTTGDLTLTATRAQDRITVSTHDRTMYHVIHVQNQAPIKSASLMGIVGFLNYLIVVLVKKWGVLFG